MGNPIAHGVVQGLRRKRAPGSSPPASPTTAWLYFVAATLCLSWLTAAFLGAPEPRAGEPLGVRLFWASLYYAATMGWQPLVGAWLAGVVRPRPARTPRLRGRHVAIGLAFALGLAGAAMLVAWGLGEPAPSAAIDPSMAAAGALVVLCVQAFTEEYGWRGAPLGWAVERWGDPMGLVLHGVAWGAWYAPLFLVPGGAAIDAGAFVVTCLMLGTVFGWLRLRSGSVVPSTLANALLTIVAGLPLLVQVGSSSARDAVFRWPGWPVLAVLALVLLRSARGSRASAPPAYDTTPPG
jgi:membrane protease YdiL (CAAX protease family)